MFEQFKIIYIIVSQFLEKTQNLNDKTNKI